MNIDSISNGIDSIDLNREEQNDEEEKKKLSKEKIIKKRITKLYRKHNPSKLSEIDSLMKKYKGKEEELLQAIKNKYGDAGCPRRHGWQHVLKRFYPNEKGPWNNDKESLVEIQGMLDGLASSIGGECFYEPNALVVQKVKQDEKIDYCGGLRGNTHESWESIQPTIEKMREIVHNRYEYYRKKKSTSKAPYLTDEHERRKEEKRIDRVKKQYKGRYKRK